MNSRKSSERGPAGKAGRGAFPQDDHDTVQFPLGFPGETISFLIRWCFHAQPNSSAGPPRGRPHCGRRGGGAAGFGGEGTGGKRRGRRRPYPDSGDSAGGHGHDPGDRRRRRHSRRPVPDRLSPPRHQQAAHRPGSGGHRHLGVSGRGTGGHCCGVPGGTLHPHGPVRPGDLPHPGGGPGALPGACRLPAGHHPGGAGPVLQHPRPAEIYEAGRCGGGGGVRPGAEAGPVPPWGVLPVYPGRQAGADDPGRRQTLVRPVCGAGPGHGPGLHPGAGRGRGCDRHRLCLPARLLPGQPDLPAFFRQWPAGEVQAPDGRLGAGL